MKGRIQNVHDKWYKGIHYKSTLEAKTAETLDLLGIPAEYENRTIILLEGFRCPYQKNKVRKITYKPDFSVGNILLECKGFETPEWKNKKKYVYKYLMDHEPDTPFYQIKDSGKQLLQALDNHWEHLGYKIQVTSKETKKTPSEVRCFNSVKEATEALGLQNKSLTSILRGLTGEKEWVYDYSWKLKKIE